MARSKLISRSARSVALVGALLTGLAAMPAGAVQPDPLGLWSRSDGNAKVRIDRCGAHFCATNTWIRDSSKGESVGDVLIMKVKQGQGAVLTGTAYDPKRKLSYSMRISGSANALSTRGCIVGGLICKTVSWTRLR